MNDFMLQSCIRTLPLTFASLLMANTTHVPAPHLSGSSIHLGGGHGTSGLNHSFQGHYTMLAPGLGSSFNSMARMPMGWNNSFQAGWGWNTPMTAMTNMPLEPMAMAMGEAPIMPVAPLAGTDLSPMATPPVVSGVPVSMTPIPVPTMSFMAQTMAGPWAPVLLDDDGLPVTNALEATSLFAFAAEKPRVFKEHDLVQIVVRETTRIESFQGLETDKEYELVGGVKAFPGLSEYAADHILDYTEIELAGDKEFDGEGEYAREDNLTTRLAAEVIEILPNGNLVLEARTRIKTDEEEMFTQLTGICRPEDITAANTILSNQIFDLKVEKMHFGQVRDAANKGILARVLDAVFAF
ncbi:MAG: flagellar basal body L-ring protein FlgH [Phycisphaerales bacterium]|nr:flagellar basal body L-ring protein FlgH [Phycisphaerales bacterium]